MAKIKTREAVKGTIKQIDKAAVAADRMKRAYIASKEKAEHSVSAAEENPTEYAYNKLEGGSNTTVHAIRDLKHAGKKGVKETKENVADVKDRIEKFKTKQAEKKKEQERNSSERADNGSRDSRLQEEPSARSEGTPGQANRSESSSGDRRSVEVRADPKIKQKTDAPKTNSAQKSPTPKPQNRANPVRQSSGNQASRTATQTGRNPASAGRKSIKSVEQPARTVKQSAKSAGKSTVKTVKTGTKTAQKGIKTAEKTAKTTIKTTKEAAKTAKKATEAAAKAARKAAHVAKVMAKAAVKATIAAVKIAVKATVATVKAIIAATKALIAAIAAGGWIAVVIVLVICLIAMLVGSVFGIFFSGEDSGTGQTIQTAVQEINSEFNTEIERIKGNTRYDYLDMSGGTAAWKEVLAIYSVKVNGDPNNAQEIATVDDAKKAQLKEIFWKMNAVTSRTETRNERQGNTTVQKVYLYIVVTHKSIDDMVKEYGFNETQKANLQELLSSEYDSMWSGVLAGI